MIKRLVQFASTALLLFAIAHPARGEQTAEDLLALVGDDVGLCAEVSQLEQRVPEAARSEFFRRLERTAFYQAWRSGDDFKKLEQTRQAAEAILRQPVDRFLADVFGESVVLAASPAENGEVAGVLLTLASDPETIDAALAALKRAEPEKPIEELTHSGHVFLRRGPKRDGGAEAKDVIYSVRFGRIWAFSNRERLIRQMIDRHRARDAASLRDVPAFRAARAALPNDTLAWMWLNPRPWDRLINSEEDSEDARKFAAVWRRIESMMISLRLQPGIIIEAAVAYDDGDLPADWSRFIESSGGPSPLFERVPRRALFALSGRVDFALAAEAFLRRLSESKREELERVREVSRGLLLGQDLLSDVLPELGPNVTAYVVPRTERADVFPVGALAAIELPPRDERAASDPPSTREGLDNALNVGLNVLAAWRNGERPEARAVVRTRREAAGVTRWIESTDPFHPAFALTEDALLFASAPELITEFRSNPADQGLTADPDFRAWSREFAPNANQALYLNFAAIRALLAERREFFVRQTVRDEGISPKEAERRLDALGELLGLFDGVFAAVAIEPARLRFTAGAMQRPAESE